MKSSTEKQIIALFLVMFALLSGTTIAALRNINRSMVASDWVNHTHAVISEAEGIVLSLNAGEKALRDFLLGGNERDRALSRRSYAEAAEHLTAGKALTRSEPPQNKEFLQLEGLVAKRVDFARDVIRARIEGGFDAGRKIINEDRDETGDIQREVGRLKAEEESLLRARDQESYLQAQNTRWIVFVGVAVNAAILIFMGLLVRDDIAARRWATLQMEEANRRLEVKIEEKTHDLSDANKALEHQILEERWANQALDHQLRYNHLIINSIDSLVLVISKASNVTRINPAVTRRTGFESRDIVGRPLRGILAVSHSVDSEEPSRGDEVAACMRDGRDLIDSEAVLEARGKHGTPVTFSVYPIRDRDKIVGGVVTINLPAGVMRSNP